MKTQKYSFRIGRTDDDDSFIFERVHGVLSAEELLSTNNRNEAIDQVRRQSGAQPEYFNTLYHQLIDSFAEFVQNIPNLKNKRISCLDKQLAIASTIITLREPFILAGDLLNRVADDEKALWNYVMFSGWLLSRIGDTVSQYSISLCDEAGIPLNKWDPLVGSFNIQGEFYRIDKMGSDKPTFPSYHLTIASKLMPADGLHWIMSNADAFEQWVMILNGEGDQERPSLFYIALEFLEDWLRAQFHPSEYEGEFLTQETDLVLEEMEDFEALLNRFLKKSSEDRWHLVESHQATERALGEQFLAWLRKGIANQTLAVNKKNAAIFMTREGALLINPAIFNQFKAQHRLYANRNVLRAFSQLPMMSNAKLQLFKSQFPGEQTHQLEGVIVKNPKALFARDVPAETNYVVKTQSSYTRSEQMLATRSEDSVKKAKQQDLSDSDAAKDKTQKEYPLLKQQYEKMHRTPPTGRKGR